MRTRILACACVCGGDEWMVCCLGISLSYIKVTNFLAVSATKLTIATRCASKNYTIFYKHPPTLPLSNTCSQATPSTATPRIPWHNPTHPIQSRLISQSPPVSSTDSQSLSPLPDFLRKHNAEGRRPEDSVQRSAVSGQRASGRQSERESTVERKCCLMPPLRSCTCCALGALTIMAV